jgi:hypothetical protein
VSLSGGFGRGVEEHRIWKMLLSSTLSMGSSGPQTKFLSSLLTILEWRHEENDSTTSKYYPWKGKNETRKWIQNIYYNLKNLWQRYHFLLPYLKNGEAYPSFLRAAGTRIRRLLGNHAHRWGTMCVFQVLLTIPRKLQEPAVSF